MVSFLLPFFGAFSFSKFALGWSLHAAEISGIALSTTSVAVVYAVMVETGLNRQDIGKLILAACFVTDLGTVMALGGLFATYGWLLLVFVIVTAVSLFLLPRAMRIVIARVGHRVSEPEVKVIFVVLLALGGLATVAGSEAVLPAYVAGLVVAGVFMQDRVILDRIRTIAFALLIPFFFLRAGTLISAPALVLSAGVIGALCLVKMVTKFVGVWSTSTAFRIPVRERTYTTLLMATGLTFGSIAALFGLNHHLIDEVQYTELARSSSFLHSYRHSLPSSSSSQSVSLALRWPKKRRRLWRGMSRSFAVGKVLNGRHRLHPPDDVRLKCDTPTLYVYPLMIQQSVQ